MMFGGVEAVDERSEVLRTRSVGVEQDCGFSILGREGC